MEYLGDLIQYTGGLIGNIDTISFLIGMVTTLVLFFTYVIWSGK